VVFPPRLGGEFNDLSPYPYRGVNMHRLSHRFGSLPRSDKALLIAMVLIAIAMLPCYALGIVAVVNGQTHQITPTPTRQRVSATGTRAAPTAPVATVMPSPTLIATATEIPPIVIPEETLEPTPTQFTPPTPEPTLPGATPSITGTMTIGQTPLPTPTQVEVSPSTTALAPASSDRLTATVTAAATLVLPSTRTATPQPARTPTTTVAATPLP
jgi:hypothetical protein